jgi:hypothetical protein
LDFQNDGVNFDLLIIVSVIPDGAIKKRGKNKGTWTRMGTLWSMQKAMAVFGW